MDAVRLCVSVCVCLRAHVCDSIWREKPSVLSPILGQDVAVFPHDDSIASIIGRLSQAITLYFQKHPSSFPLYYPLSSGAQSGLDRILCLALSGSISIKN